MKSSTFLMALLCLSLTVFADGGKGGVRFGSKANNCEGSGICKATHTSTNLTEVGFDYHAETQILDMAIDKQDMTEDQFNTQNRQLHFLQASPMEIDDAQLLSLFKVNGTLNIPKGNYPVTETEKLYIVHFKVLEE